MVRSSRYLNAGGQRTRTEIAREIDRLFLAAEASDAAGIFDLCFNGGDADRLVIENDGELVVDVGFGVTAEALAGIGREGEIGLPSADVALGGTRVAHLLAADDGVLANQIPLLAFACPRGFQRYELGVERKNAAVLRKRGVRLGYGPSFTSSISSTAAVPINSLTRAGSSTPGNCTRIW